MYLYMSNNNNQGKEVVNLRKTEGETQKGKKGKMEEEK